MTYAVNPKGSLGLLPRQEIRHTSEAQAGQIYMPRVNTLLLIGVLLLVGATVLVVTNGYKQVREIYIFAGVLVLQSLPFLAAVTLRGVVGTVAGLADTSADRAPPPNAFWAATW